MAPFLIAQAWQLTRSAGTLHKPWSWADTHPLAKLSIADQELYILAGARGRILAFSQEHMSPTERSGESGNSVIVSHRNTHFSSLQRVALGNVITVQKLDRSLQYRVQDLNVVYQSQTEVLLEDGQSI